MSGGASQQTLGGPSQCGRVLGPSLDKIIKNVAWRKHSQLVSAAKSSLDQLQTLTDLPDLLSPAAEPLLLPLLLALDSNSPKIIEPALDCISRMLSLSLFPCEIDLSPTLIVSRLIASVSKCSGVGDEAVELGVLKVLLSAVRSPCVLIRGDCLIHIVRTCYNVYLGGLNGTNQICAKSVLAQMMVIVFTRLEEDSLVVNFNTVSVSDLLEFTDRNLNEGSSVQFVQNFINEVVQASEGVVDSKISLQIESKRIEPKGDGNEGLGDGESNEGADSEGGNKIKEDGFLLFKNLCKLSMKFSSQENPDDQILLRGKILSLELLKVIMDNAGPIWRTNER